jgi:hypothetical protein
MLQITQSKLSIHMQVQKLHKPTTKYSSSIESKNHICMNYVKNTKCSKNVCRRKKVQITHSHCNQKYVHVYK